jgi:GT2 family glycosyltransferase
MISIVICSNNPARLGAVTEQYRNVMPAGETFEIVPIRDAKGLCEGYNRGLAASRGDIVVFSHDDIEIWTPDFAPRLRSHLSRFDGVGVAGTSLLWGPSWYDSGPMHSFGRVAHLLNDGGYFITLYGIQHRVVGGMQAMDGVFLAFRREVIEKVGWDAQTYTGFHLYDTDCTYRAYRMGYNLAVAVDLPIMHISHGVTDSSWEKFARIFLTRHAPTLGSLSRREFQHAAVRVATKAEAIQIMNSAID